MAKTDTKTKKSTTKKAPVRSTVKKSTVTTSSASAPAKKKMTLADLRSKVMDPKNRKSLILALGIIVLAVVIYLSKGLFIAATVNGQPISRFAVIKDLENQSGSITLESMITRAMVFQEAGKKNVEASQKEIDDEIAKIEKQFKDQGQDFNQLLAAQGLSKEKFQEEVRIQIIVTKLLGDQAKVTDKEFNDFLASNQDLLESEENKDAAKATLRQQMEQQKLAQKYQEWVANLKKGAKINYFVNY